MKTIKSLIQKMKLVLTVVFIGLFNISNVSANPPTALVDYINTPDPVFSFSSVAVLPLQGLGVPATVHVLHLTSQQWRSSDEVDRTTWEHALIVIVPDTVVSTTSMMFVTGGDNNSIFDFLANLPNEIPDEITILSQVAIASGTVVSILNQVPNQPLVFTDEPGVEHFEDDLVAYTFDKLMRTNDTIWPAYLPMVKSAVRAMDAVQTYVPAATSGVHSISDFVVAGFSKRGATAWLTAAVDSRVTAVAPSEFDILNMAPSAENHRASYGSFSEAVAPYVEYDIFDRFRIPEGKDLRAIIDPFSYLDDLSMPKYMIYASGDEFFTPDSSLFYADDLQGEALFRYIPNSNHSGDNGGVETAFAGLLSWYQHIVTGLPRPQINWSLEEEGLHVTTDGTPLQATLWQATNPNGRDFRFDELGAIWTSSSLTSVEGEYVVQVNEPSEGWTAYFVELVFPGLTGIPQTYTTSVFITPDEHPFGLEQAINDPKKVRFWYKEFAAALGNLNRDSTYDAETLQSFLPVRVFDQYISTLEEAEDALGRRNDGQRRKDKYEKAVRECLAVRLNIESSRIDWYSPIIRHGLRDHLWEKWNLAHEAYLEDRPRSSRRICRRINRS